MILRFCKSPFPIPTPLGRIIDERCKCGALRSEHADTVAFGHGPRLGPRAELLCARFTWMATIVETTDPYGSGSRETGGDP
jgi:hypothetical protein